MAWLFSSAARFFIRGLRCQPGFSCYYEKTGIAATVSVCASGHLLLGEGGTEKGRSLLSAHELWVGTCWSRNTGELLVPSVYPLKFGELLLQQQPMPGSKRDSSWTPASRTHLAHQETRT